MITAKEAKENSEKNRIQGGEDPVFYEIEQLVKHACMDGETDASSYTEKNTFPKIKKELEKNGFRVKKGQAWNNQIDFTISW